MKTRTSGSMISLAAFAVLAALAAAGEAPVKTAGEAVRKPEVPSEKKQAAPERFDDRVQAEVADIRRMFGDGTIMVLLKVRESREAHQGRSRLAVFIGPSEAFALARAIKQMHAPRPMTHDLIGNFLTGLGASLKRITVTRIKDNTYYAAVTVRHDDKDIDIDARPSDALVLAVSAGAPIYVDDKLVGEAGIPRWTARAEEPDQDEADLDATF
jgi:uncharacterized protein